MCNEPWINFIIVGNLSAKVTDPMPQCTMSQAETIISDVLISEDFFH